MYNNYPIFIQSLVHKILKSNSFKHILIIICIIFLLNKQLMIIASQQFEDIDPDGDGIPNEYDSDDDGDEFPDRVELEEGTDPLNKSDYPKDLIIDNDGDSIPDSEDPDDDNDRLSDIEEKNLFTDPQEIDTDSDRIYDYKEIQIGTNPINKDSDNDGFIDGDEIFAETDPLNKKDFPTSVIANAGLDQIVFPNERVTLKPDLSIGNIINYSWDFDASDGIQTDTSKKIVEYTFDKEGAFTVTLTVTDNKTTDADTCLIIVDSLLAVEMGIIKNKVEFHRNYYKEIALNLKSVDNRSLKFEVNGSLQDNALVSLTFDPYTMMIFDDEEIIVKFDNVEIENLEMVNVVNSIENQPKYNISKSYDKIRILLNIPHFSSHIITVEKIKKETQEFPPESHQKDELAWIWISIFGIICILIIGVCYILAYSLKKGEADKFYRKLSIDADSEIIDKIKRENIDWEDYDSEKY
jgi:hypothetical protein